jgi:Thioesterase-like superfamily
VQEALFTPVGDDLWRPHEATRGPWDPTAQHGGAAAALAGALIERVEPGAAMRVVRTTVELLRPVPLTDLRSEVEIVRGGKRVQLVGARLFAGDELLVRAVALRLRRDESSAAPPTPAGPAPPGGPDEARGLKLEHVPPGLPMFGHEGVDLRYLRGDWGAGAAFTWIALRMPVVAGEEPSPLQRVLAAADFGNGVSAVLDWGAWAFVNPDLTVYLERDPVGRWVGLDAETRVGADGTAVAESELYDERGRIGRAVQALLVQPRR